MSALETTVRVNSEKQTLILAGEPIPRQSLTEPTARSFAFGAAASRPLTLVATPVDDPILIDLAPSTRFAQRGSTYSAADAYTRTQQLTAGSSRAAIIDTYA